MTGKAKKRLAIIFVLIVAALAGSFFALSAIKVDDYVYGTGFITTPSRSRVFPAESGPIKAILAVDGQRVKEGDVLVELEDIDQASLIERRRAEMNLAQVKVDKQIAANAEEMRKRDDALKLARVVLENARAEHERAVNLGSAMPREEAERRKLELDLASLRYEAAQNLGTDTMEKEIIELKGNVEVARKLLAEAEKALEKRKVRSPISGVLSLSILAVGELVSDSVSLGEVFDASTFVILVKVPERHVHKVRKGQAVSASIVSYPHADYGYFPAKVLGLAEIVTPQSSGEGLLLVEAELEKSKLAFKPGMSADVRILVGRTSLFHRLVSID